MTEWTLMPVPVENAAAFRRLVAEKVKEEAPPIASLLDSPSVRRALVVDEEFAKVAPWDVADLRRFAADDKTTTERFAEVMDLCVRLREESGENSIISTRQIAERTTMTVEGWRAACRWIGRYLETAYPGVPRWPSGAPQWPLANVSGKQLGVYDELYVGITAEQAKRWKSVR